MSDTDSQSFVLATVVGVEFNPYSAAKFWNVRLLTCDYPNPSSIRGWIGKKVRITLEEEGKL